MRKVLGWLQYTKRNVPKVFLKWRKKSLSPLILLSQLPHHFRQMTYEFCHLFQRVALVVIGGNRKDVSPNEVDFSK